MILKSVPERQWRENKISDVKRFLKLIIRGHFVSKRESFPGIFFAAWVAVPVTCRSKLAVCQDTLVRCGVRKFVCSEGRPCVVILRGADGDQRAAGAAQSSKKAQVAQPDDRTAVQDGKVICVQ